MSLQWTLVIDRCYGFSKKVAIIGDSIDDNGDRLTEDY
jgi:hypothetical protein